MLTAQGIQKSFQQAAKKLEVLKGIDLQIKSGEILSIVGPSGAGKSTLLHILGGLDAPSQGSVTIEGQEIYKLSDEKRARLRNERIGFVFQFYHLLPELTALENVFLPAMIKSNQDNFKDFQQRGNELLGQVGLNERTEHKPNQLSGGEQQRVAIARALMNKPDIIFCDEPTGNLDSESGRHVIELLLGLNQKNQQTLVIVTHDEEIAGVSHRTVRIKDGLIAN